MSSAPPHHPRDLSVLLHDEDPVHLLRTVEQQERALKQLKFLLTTELHNTQQQANIIKQHLQQRQTTTETITETEMEQQSQEPSSSSRTQQQPRS